MSIDPNSLRIVRYPDPVLRQKARPIETITDEVQAVAARMFELMAQADGVGLAAPQVGLSWRLFVTRALETEPSTIVRVFINPTIEVIDPTPVPHEEGCLSLPRIEGDVRRPSAVRIRATGIDKVDFELESDAFPGRVWQHENDHLDGILIIDRFSAIDRLTHRKAIRELEAARIA